MFFQTHKGSVTSFSILFNFQGPVAPSASRLTAYLLYHRSGFCQALFFEVLRFSRTCEFVDFSASRSNLTSSYWFFRFTSQRLSEVILSCRTWCSSIIPHSRLPVNTFLPIFSSFFLCLFFYGVFPRFVPAWTCSRIGFFFLF